MKRLFLTILCGVGLSLATADTTTNLPNASGGNSALSMTKQNSEQQIKNFQMRRQILKLSEKEVRIFLDLVDYLESENYEKAKELLEFDKDLLIASVKTDNALISILGLIINGDIEIKDKVKVVEFLYNNGLDLNAPCSIKYNENKEFVVANAPYFASIFSKNDENFELFKFLASKKIKIDNALMHLSVAMENNDKLDKYVREIFKHYTIDDMSNMEVVNSAYDFIKQNKVEFIKLLIDSGLKKNKSVYEYVLYIAKQNNASKEILNLLQGE